MFLLRLSQQEKDAARSQCSPVSHGSLFLAEQGLLLALAPLCDTLGAVGSALAEPGGCGGEGFPVSEVTGCLLTSKLAFK